MKIFLIFLLLCGMKCWGMREGGDFTQEQKPKTELVGLSHAAYQTGKNIQIKVNNIVNKCWEISSKPSAIVKDFFFYRLIPRKTAQDSDYINEYLKKERLKLVFDALNAQFQSYQKILFEGSIDEITFDESYVLSGIPDQQDWSFYNNCNSLYLHFLQDVSFQPKNANLLLMCDILIASPYVENDPAEHTFFDNLRWYFEHTTSLSEPEKNKLDLLLMVMMRASLAKIIREMTTYNPLSPNDIKSFEQKLGRVLNHKI